jgi:hypothetical protein
MSQKENGGKDRSEREIPKPQQYEWWSKPVCHFPLKSWCTLACDPHQDIQSAWEFISRIPRVWLKYSLISA